MTRRRRIAGLTAAALAAATLTACYELEPNTPPDEVTTTTEASTTTTEAPTTTWVEF